LGGLTLTPGVYFFSSAAQLTGQLTLDFEGDPDALFIFQIGSTLTTASDSSIVMIDAGLQPHGCEVYWQVGSSATLGTNTDFVGTIVALTSVTLNTGASIISGRALARNGAVTLDTNVITIEGCETVSVTGSISGTKFNDLNGNGLQDAGEPGLAGVTVFLDDGNGVLDAGEETRLTDIDGNYTFAGLAADTYIVRQVTPAGMANTTPNPVTVTLGSDEDITGVDFGDQLIVIVDGQVVSIRGAKFRDVNGNGVRNAGEPGLQGWTIFLDTNDNGFLDAGETSTLTDANGNYTFFDLGPGTYRVREVRPLGWVQMTNNPPDIVITSLGQNVTASPLGNARATALIRASKLSLIGRNMAPGVLGRQARFVANLYEDLLGRAPDLAGLRRYVRLLQAGFSRARVAAIFRADFGL
jgi:ice-binding like protein/SdrD B-like protein/uncharacterized protein DUF4214